MKKKYFIKGLKTLNKNGSLIFCENCEKILGSINQRGYRYINLGISCTCDGFGSFEIATAKSTSDPYDMVNNMPKTENGIAVCQKCGTHMFGIIDKRVKSYSFYVECVCGAKYDLRSTFPDRLGETLDNIKKSRKLFP